MCSAYSTRPSIDTTWSYPSFRLGCCPCPIQQGWQHQAMSNTGSPCVSVLQASAIQATFPDISLDTFRPCLSKLSFPSEARKWQICDRFDTGCGMLYMSTPSQPPTVKVSWVSWVVRLRVFHLGLWCHRSCGSWCSHCGKIAFSPWCSIPMFY